MAQADTSSTDLYTRWDGMQARQDPGRAAKERNRLERIEASLLYAERRAAEMELLWQLRGELASRTKEVRIQRR